MFTLVMQLFLQMMVLTVNSAKMQDCLYFGSILYTFPEVYHLENIYSLFIKQSTMFWFLLFISTLLLVIVYIPRVTALTPVAFMQIVFFFTLRTECSHLSFIVCRTWRPWWLTQSRAASTPSEACRSSSPCLHSWITANRPAMSWTPLSGKHRLVCSSVNHNDFCLSATQSKNPHVGVL